MTFPSPDRSTFVDPPFAVPPDIVLDLPVPPSVNRTRKLDMKSLRATNEWKSRCDTALMASGQFRAAKRIKIGDRFELTIILCEKQCRLDADNPVKAAIDYLRRLELIKDDDKRYLRRLVVEWGEAPSGCRLILRGAA